MIKLGGGRSVNYAIARPRGYPQNHAANSLKSCANHTFAHCLRTKISSRPDAILTVVIRSLSDSAGLLRKSDSFCPRVLVQCICCWTRLPIVVRAADKVLRIVAGISDQTY